MADGEKSRLVRFIALVAVIVAVIGLLLQMTLARPELRLDGSPIFKSQPPPKPAFGMFWMDVRNTGKLSVTITNVRGKLNLAPPHIDDSTKACRDDLSKQSIRDSPEDATLLAGQSGPFSVLFSIPESCIGLNEPFRADVRFSGHDKMYIPYRQTVSGIASLTDK